MNPFPFYVAAHSSARTTTSSSPNTEIRTIMPTSASHNTEIRTNNQDNALLSPMVIEGVAHEQATVSTTRNPEELQPQSHTYTMS